MRLLKVTTLFFVSGLSMALASQASAQNFEVPLEISGQIADELKITEAVAEMQTTVKKEGCGHYETMWVDDPFSDGRNIRQWVPDSEYKDVAVEQNGRTYSISAEGAWREAGECGWKSTKTLILKVKVRGLRNLFLPAAELFVTLSPGILAPANQVECGKGFELDNSSASLCAVPNGGRYRPYYSPRLSFWVDDTGILDIEYVEID